MSSSPPADDARTEASPPARGMVLLTPSLPERQRIAKALRHRGFVVVERAMAQLLADAHDVSQPLTPDAQVEGPRGALGIVFDGDHPRATELAHALRSGRGSGSRTAADGGPTAVGPALAALVESSHAGPLGLGPRDRSFERPIDLVVLVRFLMQVVPDEADDGSAADGAPSGNEPSELPPAPSQRPGAHDFPAIAGLPEVEQILPDVGLSPSGTGQSAAKLSADIESLLESNEQRVMASKPLSDAEGPVVDAEPVLVPPEMLAGLDELLVGEDDGSATGVGISQRTGQQSTAAASAAGVTAQEITGAHGPVDTGVGGWNVVSAPGEATGAAPPPADSAPLPQPPSEPPSPFRSGPPPESTAQVAPPRRASAPPAKAPSQPPGAKPQNVSSRPPLALSDAIAVPSPRIGTVPPGTIPMPSGMLPHSEPDPPATPPWPAAITVGSDWLSPSEPPAAASPPPSSAAELTDPASAYATEPPKTANDPLGFFTDAPLGTTGSAPELQRPSSIPPTGTWSQRAASALGAESSTDSDQEPLLVLAQAIANRVTGALSLEHPGPPPRGGRTRWIVLRDGDMVTAASDVAAEGLLPFLVERGDLSAEVAERQASRLPNAGRHAAAALIAHGFLGQDELWTVLRSHAEWIIARALSESPARSRLDRDPPERLRAEPNVFGGAAGVEVFVESTRRIVSPEHAVASLGGPQAKLAAGAQGALLAESALTTAEVEAVRGAVGAAVSDVLARQGPEFAPVLYALVALHVLDGTPRRAAEEPEPAPDRQIDPLDAQAVRERVRARLALVHESDYFSLLGIAADATEYEIRRAFVDLRRTFEPSRLLTSATADLADDVRLIVEVLEEAYQILRDPHRRSRYRRAILETAH